jgi:hypothetical protein
VHLVDSLAMPGRVSEGEQFSRCKYQYIYASTGPTYIHTLQNINLTAFPLSSPCPLPRISKRGRK